MDAGGVNRLSVRQFLRGQLGSELGSGHLHKLEPGAYDIYVLLVSSTKYQVRH